MMETNYCDFYVQMLMHKADNVAPILPLTLAILYINAECTSCIIIFFYVVFMPYSVSVINVCTYLERTYYRFKVKNNMLIALVSSTNIDNTEVYLSRQTSFKYTYIQKVNSAIYKKNNILFWKTCMINKLICNMNEYINI